MQIMEVSNRGEMRRFLRFPYDLYQGDSYWVPPLYREVKKMFDRRRNPMFSYCDSALFLAIKNGAAVGRIAAFVDTHYNEHWQSAVGCFGSYECVRSQEVANGLLTVTRNWLLSKGMTVMRGPINFESQNWGFIIEGFQRRPVLMSPYNPAYYNEHMDSFGLTKAKDLESYLGESRGYILPERFTRHMQRLKDKYNISVRCVDMKHLQRDIEIITDLTNRSIAGNWGFTPVSRQEAAVIARDIKLIIDPSVVFIVESRGEPIGYSIALPDINVIIKKCNGRLYPFGILRLLWGIKKLKEYRLWALGIVKEFQRRALDTFLYISTCEALRPRGASVEANYVLEDNYAMKDAVLKLGMRRIRTYRVYEMPLG